MTATQAGIGAYIHGPPASARALVRHGELLDAYAEGAIDDDREAYLSHFVFGPELQAHYAANRGSVAGFAGPCSCRWLHFDIDRADDLQAALEDARRLVQFIHARYPELEGEVPVYFSGSKGFHVLIELAHSPPPSVQFPQVARTFAEGIAAAAGVRIDSAIYDRSHILRLPNSRHPKTGLFKRLIDIEGLFMRDVAGHLTDARSPWPSAIPFAGKQVPRLADDWHEAERVAARALEARATIRRDAGTAAERAPRWLLDFLRFGADVGERHGTLFRSAAWLTEQGAPSSLVSALLTEPGQDVGLPPADVARQIRCGIEHALKQRGEGGPPA